MVGLNGFKVRNVSRGYVLVERGQVFLAISIGEKSRIPIAVTVMISTLIGALRIVLLIGGILALILGN